MDNFGSTDISDRLEGSALVVVTNGIARFSDLRGDALSGRSFKIVTYLQGFELCSRPGTALTFASVLITADCLPVGPDALNVDRGSVAGFFVEVRCPGSESGVINRRCPELRLTD